MELFQPDPNNIGQVLIDYDENGVPQFNKRVVITAANRFKCGSVVLGIRHWCPKMCEMVDRLGLDSADHEQGFVDQFGHFLTREEAFMVVYVNNQKLRMPPLEDGVLYSENLH